jgi:hypothetical protein
VTQECADALAATGAYLWFANGHGCGNNKAILIEAFRDAAEIADRVFTRLNTRDYNAIIATDYYTGRDWWNLVRDRFINNLGRARDYALSSDNRYE